jgi:predicted nuclease of predicted toxin-antitoxin system
VKLLFDENLPPRLAETLANLYPGSIHVHECGLGSTDDSAIWQYAKENGFAIVSKDSDFQERSVLRGSPPKIIWLRVANCTTSEIDNLLRAAVPVIRRFINEEEESCLVLGPRSKT